MVRCLASLISDFGILRPMHLSTLEKIYRAWAMQTQRPFEVFAHWLESKHGLLRNVPIMTCAVWDTVRPIIVEEDIMDDYTPEWRDLRFVERSVIRNLKFAFQALALHETRKYLSPVLWDSSQSTIGDTTVKQTWFVGKHGAIGGASPDLPLANISLLWMMSQFLLAVPEITFDSAKLLEILRSPSYFGSSSSGFRSSRHYYSLGKFILS